MKKLFTVLLAALLLLTLAACGGKTESAENDEAAEISDSEYVKEKGSLVVGVTDFAPMDYMENGEWTGFDAEMARAFADYLGVEAEIVEINWDTRTMELDSKSIDCVWNGMTISNEAKAAMTCTGAYCYNAQVVVVPSDGAEVYADAEACKGLSFAVEAGSAGEEVAADMGFDYISVESQADALMEVASGTSDACVIDLLMASAMTGEGTSYPDLVYTAELNSEEYGVGFRKGSDLAAMLDKFFDESYESGTLIECAEKYGLTGALVER